MERSRQPTEIFHIPDSPRLRSETSATEARISVADDRHFHTKVMAVPASDSAIHIALSPRSPANQRLRVFSSFEFLSSRDESSRKIGIQASHAQTRYQRLLSE